MLSPNPFTTSTTLSFRLGKPENLQFTVYNLQSVSIKIYDLFGREVATVVDEVMQPGEHVVRFDAGSLPAGVYILKESSVFSRQSLVGKLIKF